MNRPLPSSEKNPFPQILRTWLYCGILLSTLLGACGDSGTTPKSDSGPSWWLENSELVIVASNFMDTSGNSSTNTTDVSLCSDIKFTFNKDVMSSTAESGITVTDSLSNPVPGSVSYHSPTKTATWSIDTGTQTLLKENDAHTVTLNAITSEDGSSSLPETSIQFTTAPKLSISSTIPTDFATDVSRNTMISMTFNKPLDPDSVDDDDFYILQNAFILSGTTVDYLSASNTVTITYSGLLGDTVPVSIIYDPSTGDPVTGTGCGSEEFTPGTNILIQFTTGSAGDTTPPVWTGVNPILKPENALQIRASWDNCTVTDDTNIAGYNVWRSTANMWPGSFTKINSNLLPSVTKEFTNSNTGDALNPSTTYHFVIGAEDAAGNEGFSTMVSIQTPALMIWTSMSGTGLYDKYIGSNGPYNCTNCHQGTADLLLDGTAQDAHDAMYDRDSPAGETESETTTLMKIVKPFDPKNSTLFKRINVPEGLDPNDPDYNYYMPNIGDHLTNTEVEKFLDWINEGGEYTTD